MKILVVDDIEQNRLMMDRLLQKKQHRTLFAVNGREAVEKFSTEDPDLILMDILMPVMNGFEATAAIRHLNNNKWVPIVILSAIDGEENIVKGLEAGADDYLPKPINPAILYAKLTSFERSIELQNRIYKANEELRAYRNHNEIEQSFAQNIFDRLINRKDLNDKQLDYWLVPARRFSGDLICVKRIDTKRLYFMLADSTGHGLAAALPTIIVNQVFQRMAQRGLLVSRIAREINKRLKNELPVGHFVALALGMIDYKNRLIELWNGGMPEQWVLNDYGIPIKTFESTHTFAGILDDATFDDSTEIWQWQNACEIFLYSDGITEMKCDDAENLGSTALLAMLQEAKPGERIRVIQTRLAESLKKNEMLDDISCLSIQCG